MFSGSLCLIILQSIQGWEFAHQFFELIARFLRAKKIESAICLFFERIALSLFFKERCEQIAHSYSYVMSDRSNSLMVALL